MGRRDAVQVTLEVVTEMRRLLPALVVSYEPGWETRGNGTSANYDFGVWHHTASVTSAAKPFPTQSLLRDGRSDLSGPLCNESVPWCTVERPRLHVIAAHPANHAGASRASGPVPKLSLFNPRARGLEIDYSGATPMTDGQELVAKVWGRAVAKVVGGGDIEHIRAHMETSITGKWDIGCAPGKTYDMAAFRRSAAAISSGTGEWDVMATKDEIKLALREVLLSDAQVRDELAAHIFRMPQPDSRGIPIVILNEMQGQLSALQRAVAAVPTREVNAEYVWRMPQPDNRGIPIIALNEMEAMLHSISQTIATLQSQLAGSTGASDVGDVVMDDATVKRIADASAKAVVAEIAS